jgi:inorganic pyrophosphatase
VSFAVITCRPVGLLRMEDEAGADAKILAVPTEDITGLYRHVHNVDDVDRLLRLQIEHFFDHYKDLETGKWVDIKGWEDADAARREILDSVERYNALPEKPANW